MRPFLRSFATPLLCAWALALPSYAAPNAPDPRPAVTERMAVFEILVAEISAQRGDWANAAPVMLSAAQRSRDAALFRRSIELALAARDTSTALHAAREWALALPQDANAYRYSLQLQVGTGRLAQSAPALQQMLRHSSGPDRAEHLALLPHYFSKVSDKPAAVAVVRQALLADLDSPSLGAQARSALARMHAWAGENALAWEQLQQAHQRYPESDEPALAVLQIGASLGPEALAVVEKRLAQQPGSALQMAWARQLLEEQKIDAAAQQLLGLTQTHPDYADGWLLKGSLEMQTRRNEAARASLERFLTLSSAGAARDDGANATPRSVAEAQLLLAQLAEQRKDYAQALVHLDAIRSPEHTARILTRRASLAAAQGQVDEAMAYLQEMPTPDAEALRTRFAAQLQLMRDQQRHAQAYALTQEAAQAFPQEPLWLYERAMSAEKLGHLEEMETLLRQVIAQHPDYHAAYNALGYFLADRNKQLDEALALIQKALEFAPKDAYIIDSLGWVQYRRGQLDEALAQLQRAFDAMPDAEIAAHLGEVLWMKNQRDHAKAVWRKGLQINAENATLQDTLKRFNVRP